MLGLVIRYAIVDVSVPPMRIEADFVQLRDKSVTAGELYRATGEWMRVLAGSGTKLLVNHRVDVALAAGADGVHLTSPAEELQVEQVRRWFPLVSVSCHSVEEVRKTHADLVLFGPVFEKRVAGEVVVPGVGLEALRLACAASRVPVLALGGVDEQRIGACVKAGAAGVAGIRMFAR